MNTLPIISDSSDDFDLEFMHKVWERRAARLAEVPLQEDEGEHIALVLIQFGQEVYGLEAQYVFDIRTLEHVTPVPRTPDWVAGVVNLRGRIISVLDLQCFFGLPDIGTGREFVDLPPSNVQDIDETVQYLVVVQTPEMELALLTDEVLTVKSVPVSQVQEVANTMMLNIRPDYVRGIVPHDKNTVSRSQNGNTSPNETHTRSMLIILDLPVLLADKRLVIQEEIA